MQLINFFLALLLPLLALAQDTTIATITSTQTITRTVHVSQVSTLTLTSSSSVVPSNTTSSFVLSTTSAAANTTAPIITGTGGIVIPTTTSGGPTPSASGNAATVFSASNAGLLGVLAVAIAALV